MEFLQLKNLLKNKMMINTLFLNGYINNINQKGKKNIS